MNYTLFAGRYFGIPVRIHFTFPLILVLFGAEAWIRGVWQDGLRAVALVLSVFVCVVLHELGHSLQVRRYGIAVRDIILLPIGGMARAERLPERPWQEFVVAVSGPLVNFAIAAALLCVVVVRENGFDLEHDYVSNLFAINLVLGTFNLIPAFPMDGGRILRALLAMRYPYLVATRYAKNVGQVIALLFVIVGFSFQSFIMLPVIAVFIYFGAINEERMLRVKTVLEGRVIGEFAAKRGGSLSPKVTAREVLDSIGGGSIREWPVVFDGGARLGVVHLRDIDSMIAAGLADRPVGEIATFDFPVLNAGMPAHQAYYFLKAKKVRFAAVVEGHSFVGLVFLDELMSGG